MIALGIDTASEFGSLCLRSEDSVLDELPMHAPEGFSGVLFGHLQTLLNHRKLRCEDIDLFAASSGPGSFTGIRVGLAAAKSLAEPLDKPCFGVSNLVAMARAGTGLYPAVFLDARRGEVYGGFFEGGSAREIVAPLTRWIDSLPSETDELLTFDFSLFESALATSRVATLPRTSVPREIARWIAEIAIERWRNGESGNAAYSDANYVRRSDAELLWKDRL